ncbi:nitroreductase family protein [Thiomonas bhubaneswarensis]|uniref:Nitroreductase n=1 Tax=Thiomonas bhubaneswarensis TaxID=339866 RepID=A0A0K6HZT0_9BURK|nr:nitroreductase family protein [Thiomonas bhubaneswarensis]CUA96542.1 Nitroreductase [Thiomonas bhubaneswarensis]
MTAHLDALTLIEQQRTIRKYERREPDDAVIRRCIALAQRSPSTSNHQPYSVVWIRERALREAVLREMVCQPYVADAPTLLMVCVDWGRQDLLARLLGMANQINKPSKLVVGVADASIFSQSLVLALQASGLGVSYIASPYTGLKRVAELLNVPIGEAMPLHLIAVGHADEAPAPKPRYPIEAVLHVDRRTNPEPSVVRDYFEAGSRQIEDQGYLAVTGDPISTWREHYGVKFGAVARDRTWSPFARDLQSFFAEASLHDPC